MKCTDISLSKFANIMENISQEKRLQILCMLSKTDSLCVCEILEKLGIKQNLVSHHLKVLKELGFLKTKRKGKNIHYAINQQKFGKFKETIKQIFNI